MVYNKIIELKEIIVGQAARVEKMLNNSITGLLTRDVQVLNKIVNKQEKKVNKNEIKIDELITTILALYHPEAKDLRYVLMMARMNYDLERMGDHCVEIAQSALFLMDKPDVKPLIELPKIAEMTLAMLRDGINSFINEDPAAALALCKRKHEVTESCESIFKELLTYMNNDPKTIERAFHLITIANNFGKIADLTTNISEETIYIVDGKVIKHNRYKKYEEKLDDLNNRKEADSDDDDSDSEV